MAVIDINCEWKWNGTLLYLQSDQQRIEANKQQTVAKTENPNRSDFGLI